MKIKSFENFSQDYQVIQIINYIDLSLNESADVNSIWNKTVNKIKNLSSESKRIVLKHLIVSLLSISSITFIYNLVSNSNADIETKTISKEIIKDTITKNEWKRGYEFKLSQKGWDHIRNEEKLKLKAYRIGDGMITVGYGHAEPEHESQFKIGEEITVAKANSLLKDDLTRTADGVRRIFQEWNEKGIDVKINQDMFDALVSIAFNTGVSGLRKSELIQDIKMGKFKEAGEKIKTFNVSDSFPGLTQRRQKESQMFLSLDTKVSKVYQT